MSSEIKRKSNRASRNKKPLRILLSGFGLMGTVHARLVYECEDCELTAIVVPVSGYTADSL